MWQSHNPVLTRESNKKYLHLFGLLVVLDLIVLYFNSTVLHLFIKPLLMPVLILALVSVSKKIKGRNLLIVALLFSFAGDVFLLFEHRYPMFFIAGLSAFTITHILYSIFFLSDIKPLSSIPSGIYIIFLLVIIYTMVLMNVLLPGLGSLKIPVFFYACIICLMLCSSILKGWKLKGNAGKYMIAGAAFFVVSDSLLAVNKFYQPFNFAPVLIMFTYCTAQFLIVKAYIFNAED